MRPYLGRDGWARARPPWQRAGIHHGDCACRHTGRLASRAPAPPDTVEDTSNTSMMICVHKPLGGSQEPGEARVAFRCLCSEEAQRGPRRHPDVQRDLAHVCSRPGCSGSQAKGTQFGGRTGTGLVWGALQRHFPCPFSQPPPVKVKLSPAFWPRSFRLTAK